MREDKVTDGNYRGAILVNAPASEYGCFMVPKVVE
jgi:aspartyl-tRNA(Asn)/glutamyl-tRNA(Gln) amidotransferase subunit C